MGMDYRIENVAELLTRPVPDQSIARKLKEGYRSYPLWDNHPKGRERLVDIAEYGIAGENQKKTGPVYVRESIARRLAAINTALQQHKEVADLLGGEVELFVGVGWHEDASSDEVGPDAHSCGAVDVTLRYVRPDMGFVARSLLPMGHDTGSQHGASPDYFEQQAMLSAKDRTLQKNRRAFYWIMRGALLPEGDSQLACNPDAIWHWSYGDQMWAALTRAPYAFYGAQEIPQPR
jgi:hypothetical protein